MKDVFIINKNYQEMQGACDEVLNSAHGIDMLVITGSAGRGKTTAAQKYVTINQRAIYVRFQERLTHISLLREIAFAVAGARPRSSQTCYEMLEEQLARQRRIIFLDEADRLSLRHLNMVRDIHDECHTAIVLVGEEPLHSKLAQERRLKSRVRREIRFRPIASADIVKFYKEAMDQNISPQMATQCARHAEGDFRVIVKDALDIERRMKASGVKEIKTGLIKQVFDEVDGNGKGKNKDF